MANFTVSVVSAACVCVVFIGVKVSLYHCSKISNSSFPVLSSHPCMKVLNYASFWIIEDIYLYASK